MLQAYINSEWYPITKRENYYIDYIEGGEETLYFTIPNTSDFIFNNLIEEVAIQEDYGDCANRFIIKKRNRLKNRTEFECTLDMDVWKLQKPFANTAEVQELQTKTLSDILEFIKPNGWTIVNANIRSIKRTPELEGATAYDVLLKCRDIFSVVYKIDTIRKTVNVIDPNDFSDRGLYIHHSLNLSSYVFKGDSSSFVNRLYAYGKDGLSFADINSGKEYVEDLNYKEKVICGYWQDDRYTVKENLLADAKEKLKTLAIPKLAYTFTVIDLASVNKGYDFLNFGLYYPVRVLLGNNIEIMERVVKYRKYIDKKECHKNVVTLSTEPINIVTKLGKVSNTVDSIVEDTKKMEGSILQQAQQKASALIEEFAKKGHKYETENETYFLDALPKEKAKYVMRQNLGGIAFSQNGWNGPYTTAWTIDGRFNADFITAGTLQAIKLVGNDIEGGTIKGSTIEGNTIKGGTINGVSITGSVFTTEALEKKSILSGGKLNLYSANTQIGSIGTNQWDTDTSKKGLVFDLESTGAYMAWGAKANASDNLYTIKLMYVNKTFANYKADSLYLGANLDCFGYAIKDFNALNTFTIPNNTKVDIYSHMDMHNWEIKNVKITNLVGINGYTPYSGSVKLPTEISSSGVVNKWVNVTIRNGIIT